MQTTPRRGAGFKVLASLFTLVFFSIFIAFGVFFATSSRENDTPVIFPLVGWGFAILGAIMLVGTISAIFRARPIVRDAGSSSKRRASDSTSASDPRRCSGCGSASGEVPCPYCGAGG